VHAAEASSCDAVAYFAVSRMSASLAASATRVMARTCE